MRRKAKMISIMFNVALTENGWNVQFCPEFEGLNAQQKLDLLQDAIHDLNKKWKEVDENY